MRDHEIDLLANRLNYDAVVFKGCTMNELLVISGFCLGVCCVILAILLQFLLDNFLYGIALGFVTGGGITYFACSLFEKMRRGQEKGYLQQFIKRKLEKKGLLPKSDVIRRSGVWMIGRKIQ